MCKKLEGAVFPLWVEVVKDRIEDTIHALEVDTANHRSSAAPNLQETPLDQVVVRSFFHRCRGKWKKLSSSGRSRSNCRTIPA